MGAGSARVLAGVTGIAVGVATTSLLWQQAYIEVAIGTALACVLLRLALVVPPQDRGAIWRIALAAFAVRAASGAFLRLASLEIGRDGFVSGDDRQYFELAREFVSYLRGEPSTWVPPYWGGAAYLFGTWVYFQSMLIAIFGDHPLVPILANGAFSTLTMLTCWDLARRLFSRRSGYVVALLLTFHPSLTLWSATNLKDTLALMLIALVLWSLVRFLERPRAEPLVTAAVALVLMQSIRTYIFVGLALVIPVAVAMAPRLLPRRRGLWTATATALSVTLLVANQVGIGLAPALLSSSTQFRENMAVGARTSFQEAPPVRVEIGTTFVVPTPSPSVDATPPPAPFVVVVAQNARIVILPGGSSPVEGRPGTTPPVYVRPGDIVVVGPPGSTAAPVEQRAALPDTGGPVQLAPQHVSEEELTRQTLSYLPRGLVYALFAPWPWLSDRPIDVLAVPEMLLWYAALAALPLSLVVTRVRWRWFLGVLLFVGGTLLIFALVQGNWGTLFRHRAMVIPFALVLAAPGLLQVFDRVRSISRNGRNGRVRGSHVAGRIPNVTHGDPVSGLEQR